MEASGPDAPPAAPGQDPRPSLLRRLPGEIAPFRRPVAVGALVAAAWAVWVSGPGPATPALVVTAAAGAALAVIDARTHRLPDAVVLPTTVVAALLLALAAGITGDLAALQRAALGALVLGAVYLLLHVLNPRGLGFGDVKLAVLLGLVTGWWGWTPVWVTTVAPFLLGGLVALALLVVRRADRHTAIPFGPFMLFGAALAVTAVRLA
ncbi:prepilin peptidase [Xylanimonas oleitrophica]|uniref:Prepilin peptidase n=1 Tax=Xylanimonas oleitrophica TaxID=2607479 RepID=A0A2W5WL22_9MICO|nr:A24 family peptidase [Xylanimonas oleitrophica]PZR51890.1 prepilin peptidase [Xylanimonas oleitrophica]